MRRRTSPAALTEKVRAGSGGGSNFRLAAEHGDRCGLRPSALEKLIPFAARERLRLYLNVRST
jgi:hypothetical protein